MNSIQRKIDQVLITGIIVTSTLCLLGVEYSILRERKSRHEHLAMTSTQALVERFSGQNRITRQALSEKLDDLSNTRIVVWITGEGIEPIVPTNSTSKDLLNPALLKKADYRSIDPAMPEYFDFKGITYFTCAMPLPPRITTPTSSETLTIRFLENTTRSPLSSWQTSAQIIAVITVVSGLALLAMRGSLSQSLKPIKKLEISMKDLDLEARDKENEAYTEIGLNSYPLELHGLISEYNSLLGRISIQRKNTNFFISAISHELRTPLSLIHGYTQRAIRQLGSNADKEKIAKSLKNLKTSSEDTLITLENLVTLARTDLQSLKTNIRPFQASEFLNRLMHANETSASTAKTLPYINVVRGEEAIINSDETILRNAINSILENARKYAPDDRGVEIYGYKSQDTSYYTIDLRDFGKGISPDIKKTIFDRFVRGKNELTKASGSGLGLAVVKETLSLVSSSIQAPDNIYGQGALFRISIPLSNQKPEKEAA